MEDNKRDALRARIEASERRNAERSLSDYARDATETATDFVKEHPIATVIGVAAVGLAIGAMTRPGRSAGAKAGRRASAFASYASELGLAYASGLLDSVGDLAKTGGEKLEDLSDDVTHSARNARRAAAHVAGDKADDLRFMGRKAARQAGRSLRHARSKIGR